MKPVENVLIGLTVVAGFFLAPVAGVLRAQGQQPETETAVDPKLIDKLVILSKDLAKQKHFGAACEVLEVAAELDPRHCEARLNQGIISAMKGAKQDAVRYYEMFLRMCPKNMRAPQVRAILRQFQEGMTASREGPGPGVTVKNPGTAGSDSGWLEVGIPNNWAFVFIDGRKIKKTPLIHYRIKAGPHTVELRDGKGGLVHTWNIRVRPNERIKLLHH